MPYQLYSFLHPLVSSSLLTQILLSAPCSHTLSLFAPQCERPSFTPIRNRHRKYEKVQSVSWTVNFSTFIRNFCVDHVSSSVVCPSVRNVVCAAELFCGSVSNSVLELFVKSCRTDRSSMKISVVVVILRDRVTAILRGRFG